MRTKTSGEGLWQRPRVLPTTVLLVSLVLAFATPSVAAITYTAQACGSTTVNTVGGYILFSNCNSVGSTITVSAAAGVSFSSCTFAGVTHPNAMSNYAFGMSGGLLSSSGSNIYFASSVSAISMSIASSASITTTTWASTIYFGSSFTSSQITISGSTIKSLSGYTIFNFVSGIAGTGNTLIVSSSTISTIYQGFASTGNIVSLTMSMSASSFLCSYYAMQITGTISSSSFSFVGTTVTSTAIEVFYHSGNFVSSTFLVNGGSFLAPTTNWKNAIRFAGTMSGSSVYITGGAIINAVYPLSLGVVTSGLLSIGGSSLISSTSSDYAIPIGSSSANNGQITITIDSSATVYGCMGFIFSGAWTSISMYGSGGALISAEITPVTLSSVSSISTLYISFSGISITNLITTSGECIRLPPTASTTTTTTISLVSCSMKGIKGFYLESQGSAGTTTVSVISTTFSGISAFFYVAGASSNVNAVISGSSFSMSGNGGFIAQTSSTATLSNVGITMTSSSFTMTSGYLLSMTGSGTAVNYVLTGTSGSRTTISTYGGLYDGSTSAQTLTTVSLSTAYTDFYLTTMLLGSTSSGYLALTSPSISLGSTTALSGRGTYYYGSITGGTFYFGCSLSGSPTLAFFLFPGFLTSTSLTFQSITFSNTIGLVYSYGGSSSGSTVLITGVSVTYTGTSTASIIGFYGGTQTGMSLSITNTQLTYTVSSSGGVVAPVIFSSVTWSGSTFRSLGNTLTSSTSAVSHTAAFVYATGATIASASVVTVAKATYATSITTNSIFYATTSTITGSSLTFQCMSFSTVYMPLVYLPLMVSSSVRLESIAIWQAAVAGVAAITITSTSSASVTSTFMYSHLHVPVILNPASTASVTSIVVGCSRTSLSYPMSSGSFVSGLQSVVAGGTCSRSYQSCFTTKSPSSSVSPSFSNIAASKSETLSVPHSQSKSPSGSYSLSYALGSATFTDSNFASLSKSFSPSSSMSKIGSVSTTDSVKRSQSKSTTITQTLSGSKSDSAAMISTTMTDSEASSKSVSTSPTRSYSSVQSRSSSVSRTAASATEMRSVSATESVKRSNSFTTTQTQSFSTSSSESAILSSVTSTDSSVASQSKSLSRTASRSSSMTGTRTSSRTVSRSRTHSKNINSVSKTHSPSSEQSSVTITDTATVSRSASLTPTKKSNTITKTIGTQSRTQSKTRSKNSPSATRSLSSARTSSATRTRGSRSQTETKSLSPLVPLRFDTQLLWNSNISLSSSFYGVNGALTYLVSPNPMSATTAILSAQLLPRLLDNENVSWTGFVRHPQVPPKSVNASGSATLIGDPTTVCAALPCTITMSVSGLADVNATAAEVSVAYHGYSVMRSNVFVAVNHTGVAIALLSNQSWPTYTTAPSSSSVRLSAIIGQPLPWPSDTLLGYVDVAGRLSIESSTTSTLTVTVVDGVSPSASATTTINVSTGSELVDALWNVVPMTEGMINVTIASGSIGKTNFTLPLNVTKCPPSVTINATFQLHPDPNVRFHPVPLSAFDSALLCRISSAANSALPSLVKPLRDTPCSVQCPVLTTNTFAMVTLVLRDQSLPTATWNLSSSSAPGNASLALQVTPVSQTETDSKVLALNVISTCVVVTGNDSASPAWTPVDLDAYAAQLASVTMSALDLSSGANLSIGSITTQRNPRNWTICALNITHRTTAGRNFSSNATIALFLSTNATFRLSNGTSLTVSLTNYTWNLTAPQNSLCYFNRTLSFVTPSDLSSPLGNVSGGFVLRASTALVPPTAATVTAMVDKVSVCSLSVSNGGTLLTGNLNSCAPNLQTTPQQAPMRSTVEVLRPDGYVDMVASFPRYSPPIPRIVAVQGCPADAYPSTATCPRNGTVPITMYGNAFTSLNATSAIGWKFADQADPVLCQQLQVMSDTVAVCSYYPGAGVSGVCVVLDTRNSGPLSSATVLSTSTATLSFSTDDIVDCPHNVDNGLVCSGHGTCDYSSGICRCAGDSVNGFWAGIACSACSQFYNTSVGCLLKCPVNDQNVICSGTGYCTQGQCYCGVMWSSSTCMTCPGVGSACSGHGTCDLVTGKCTCVLDAYLGFYNGSDCNSCLSGYSGVDCTTPCPSNANGVCSGVGACQDGFCFCVAPYCGTQCELDSRVDSCLGCSLPSLYGADCGSSCPGSLANPMKPCHGHGVCDAGQMGSGVCHCNIGFGSFDCSVACPTSSGGVLCGGHGTCDSNTGNCLCSRFWATAACTVPCPTANGLPCGGHGTCSEGAYGNGACVCDAGHGGLACNVTCLGDLPCNAHGTCGADGTCSCYQDALLGFWGSSACDTCTGGYTGPSCNARCPLDVAGIPCGGHGTCGRDLTCTCYASLALGFWSGSSCSDCAAGYFGAGCLNECPGGACNPCGGNGICSQGVTGSGACDCISNSVFGWWGGSDCLSCAYGFFGSRCDQSCPSLNGVVCMNAVCDGGPTGSGTCVCKTGFAKDAQGNCLVCAAKYYGSSCQACPSTTNGTCNGRGICDDGLAGSGTCRCTGFAGGALCDKNCPSTASGVLCDNGACVNNACVCYANFTIDVSTGMCSSCSRGLYGPQCNLTCAPCQFGNCHRVSGACLCYDGYWGPACGFQCPGGANNSCSGHGQCNTTTGLCTCSYSSGTGFYIGASCAKCEPMYASDGCNRRCPTYLGQACNGRGTCFNGVCSDCSPLPSEVGLIGMYCGDACQLRDDNCFPSTCPLGFYGPRCTSLCPGASPQNLEGSCSGHGKCDVDGACHCVAGFFGSDCSGSCPAALVGGVLRSCSGRGTCRSGSCSCLAGYFGPACEVECPGGAATPCNGRGTCINGTCSCVYGAVGLACEALCPGGTSSPCAFNGVCQATGACQCYSNATSGYFTGSACDTCQPLYTGRSCTVPCLPERGVIRGSSCECFYGFAGFDCSMSCTKNVLTGVVCSGHGTCVGDELCQCDPDYYGPTCAVFCTYALCQTRNRLYRPQCNISTGVCECRTSSIGQWVGAQCDSCSSTTWGDECNLPCSCSGNGVCDRVTGKCICFGNPIDGYWTGTQCGACRAGYFGVDCLSINAQITPAATPTITSRSSPSTPVSGWMLLDTVTQLTLQGNNVDTNINVLGANSAGAVSTLNALTGVIGTTAALFLDSTSIIVVSVGGGKILLPRNASALLTMRSQPLPIQHRHLQALQTVDSSAPVYMVANGSTLCSMTWSFGAPAAVECNGHTLFTFSGTSAMLSANFVTATPQGTAIVVVGPSVGSPTTWVLCVYNMTTSQLLVTRASSLFSGEVLRCTAADETRIVCMVYDHIMKLISLHSVYLPTGKVAASQLVTSASLQCNATAMGIDVSYDTGFVAYNLELQPSTVLTFNLRTLLPMGTFELSGFYVVTSLAIDPVHRLLFGTMEDTYNTAFLSLNLFSIRAVVPDVVDLAGGALITVIGDGFDVTQTNSTYCILSGVLISGTIVDSQTVTCVAPPAKNALSACKSDTIDVRFGLRQTVQKNIGVLRPVSAVLTYAETAYGTIGYGSYDLPTQVTLIGFGFVSTGYGKCRLVNRLNEVVFVGNASYINSTAAVCEQPAPLPPTDTFSALQYSHDGTYFGLSTATYIIVGPAKSVTSEQSMNVVVSSVEVPLGLFSIFTTDVFGNRRLVLEQRQDNIRCSSNVPELAIIDSPELLNFSESSHLSRPIRSGVATFDDVVLIRPIAGDYTLYCFSAGDTSIVTEIYFTVIPGVPSTIAIAPSNGWRSGVVEPMMLLPKPSVWIEDAAGNRVLDFRALPSAMRLTFQLYTSDDITGITTVNTSVYTAAPDSNGVYAYDQVVTKTPFDIQCTLAFAPIGGTGHVQQLDVPLTQWRCQAGSEFAVHNGFKCRSCPDAAYCDGSSLLMTRPGFWRGTAHSTDAFYACAPKEACPSSSGCAEGYTGRICGSCEPGYGRSLSTCDTCWPQWINWICNVIAFLVICAVVFQGSLMSMNITNYEEYDLRKRMQLLHLEKVNGIVIKLLQSHFQMLTSIPFSTLPLPVWLKSLFATTKSGSAASPSGIVFISCSVASGILDQLYLCLLLIPALMLVFALLSALKAWWRSDTFTREEEELLRRKRIESGDYQYKERIESTFRELENRKTIRKKYALEEDKNYSTAKRRVVQIGEDRIDLEAEDNAQDRPAAVRKTNAAAEAAAVLRRQSALQGEGLLPAVEHSVDYASPVLWGVNANASSPTTAVNEKKRAQLFERCVALVLDDQGNWETDVLQRILDHRLQAKQNGLNTNEDDNEEDKKLSEDEVRVIGYQHGTMLSDYTRQWRSLDVMATDMKLTYKDKDVLMRHRAQVLSGDDPMDLAAAIDGMRSASHLDFNVRLRNFVPRFINMFLVCVCVILFQLYPTLIEYSSMLLTKRMLITDEGTICVLELEAATRCDVPSYRWTEATAVAVLVLFTIGVPLLLPILIKLVATTTCRATGRQAELKFVLSVLADARERRREHVRKAFESRQAGEDTGKLLSPKKVQDREDEITPSISWREDPTNGFDNAAKIPTSADDDPVVPELSLSQQLEQVDTTFEKMIQRTNTFFEEETDALSLEATRAIFFFVSGRYRTETWYWESFSLLKKLALSISSLIIKDTETRLFYSIYVMQAYVVCNNQVRPWDDQVLFVAENFSLCVLAVTFGLLGLLYMDITDNVKTFILIAIVVINALTVALFLRLILKTAETAVGPLKLILTFIRNWWDDRTKKNTREEIRQEMNKYLGVKEARRFRKIHRAQRMVGAGEHDGPDEHHQLTEVGRQQYLEWRAVCRFRDVEKMLLESAMLINDALTQTKSIRDKTERDEIHRAALEKQEVAEDARRRRQSTADGGVSPSKNNLQEAPQVPNALGVSPAAGALTPTAGNNKNKNRASSENAVAAAAAMHEKEVLIHLITDDLIPELYRSMMVLFSIQRYVVMETQTTVFRSAAKAIAQLRRKLEPFLKKGACTFASTVIEVVAEENKAVGRLNQNRLPQAAAMKNNNMDQEDKSMQSTNSIEPPMPSANSPPHPNVALSPTSASASAANNTSDPEEGNALGEKNDKVDDAPPPPPSLWQSADIHFDDVWVDHMFDAEKRFLWAFYRLQRSMLILKGILDDGEAPPETFLDFRTTHQHAIASVFTNLLSAQRTENVSPPPSAEQQHNQQPGDTIPNREGPGAHDNSNVATPRRETNTDSKEYHEFDAKTPESLPPWALSKTAKQFRNNMMPTGGAVVSPATLTGKKQIAAVVERPVSTTRTTKPELQTEIANLSAATDTLEAPTETVQPRRRESLQPGRSPRKTQRPTRQLRDVAGSLLEEL